MEKENNEIENKYKVERINNDSKVSSLIKSL